MASQCNNQQQLTELSSNDHHRNRDLWQVLQLDMMALVWPPLAPWDGMVNRSSTAHRVVDIVFNSEPVHSEACDDSWNPGKVGKMAVQGVLTSLQNYRTWAVWLVL